jgi:glycosyltransferase involved in cell wall biosynthesis
MSPPTTTTQAPLLAFLLPNLRGGGVQKIVTILARAMAERGLRVHVLVYEAGGPLTAQLPPAVQVVPLPRSNGISARLAAIRAMGGHGHRDLLPPLLGIHKRAWKTIGHLPALAGYLARERPAALFAAGPYLNVEAVLARRLAGTDAATRLIVSERTHFSIGKERKEWRSRVLAPLMRRAYAEADAITAVSRGVADDLAATLGLPRTTITVLYNPTLTPDVAARVAEPVDHAWFQGDGGPPVIVAVGRLAPQKDYDTLLRAFARVRARQPARLAIIGAGNDSSAQRLRGLAEELGVAADVDLLGYAPNPLRFVARAALFALSSRFEGFPNVLLEALACGTPVVSTDCPSGPREILDEGRYGALVPVGDDAALAEAILATLAAPPDRAVLRARAALFDYAAAVERYAEVLLGPEARAA